MCLCTLFDTHSRNWHSTILFDCISVVVLFFLLHEIRPSSSGLHANQFNDSNDCSYRRCAVSMFLSRFHMYDCGSYSAAYFHLKKKNMNWTENCAWLRVCQSISCSFHFFSMLLFLIPYVQSKAKVNFDSCLCKQRKKNSQFITTKKDWNNHAIDNENMHTTRNGKNIYDESIVQMPFYSCVINLNDVLWHLQRNYSFEMTSLFTFALRSHCIWNLSSRIWTFLNCHFSKSHPLFGTMSRWAALCC